jgi:carbon-monoxide dehydrogenase medium subunit
MRLWETYHRPATIDQALSLLAGSEPPVRILAGGTDLLLDIRAGRAQVPRTLIDVSDTAGLRGITLEPQGRLMIGAAVTHWEIAESGLIAQHAPALQQACGLIGGPQVRNVATLGGNVAHALPAADGSIALLTLAAQAELASALGRRWVPVEALFKGPGEAAFDRQRELLVRFAIPLRRPGEGGAFSRVMRPQGLAIALLNMAAWIRLDPSWTVDCARIAVGPCGPVPRCARAAANALESRRLTEDSLADAGAALHAEVQLRTSAHRATAEYRHHLLQPLFERVVRAAHAEAQRSAERMTETPHV